MRLAVFFIGMLLLAGCAKEEGARQVVLYTSQDHVYSEPILKEFSKEKGIPAKAVYDSESAKTAGLANRLRFEKANPVCDVFWNNEEMHTWRLAREEVLEKWIAVGYRTRRLVINTNLLALNERPASLLELTNSAWQGKFVIAYPLFGTTGLHFAALRQHWGMEQWEKWCRGLVENEAKVVDGNSVVVKMVGSGEAAIGLTDSDDIVAGQKQGFPIIALPLWPESVAIPNTIALVKGAPNPEGASELVEYLSSRPVLEKLVQTGALEGTDIETVQDETLRVNWNEILDSYDEAVEFLKEVFVRS